MSCNFESVEGKCSLKAEKGSDLCYWHQMIDGKEPTNLILNDLNVTEIPYVHLKNAKLEANDLQGANLMYANLQGAELRGANLKGANLMYANLQEANLMDANLQEADLRGADLQKAQLQRSFFDAQSQFNKLTVLTGSNLHMSLIDQAISFRYARFFTGNRFDEKECNEIIADSCNRFLYHFLCNDNIIFDLERLKAIIPLEDDFVSKLKDLNVVHEWYWNDGNSTLVLSYKSFLEYCNEGVFSSSEQKILDTLLYSPAFIPKKIVVCKNKDCLLKVDRTESYEAAFEVYNNLYNFYSQQGDLFRTKHVHYRRAEVNRKLLLHRHKWTTFSGLTDRVRSWLFDWLVLKNITEYGESTLKPVLISIFGIIAFGLAYRMINGIQSASSALGLLDCLYLSSSTFSGLGIVGVEPDFTLALMQPLIILESGFGIAMISIIIFVITYQIAR